MRGMANTQTGATAVEYPLFVGLVAIVLVAAVGVFGSAVARLFVVPWP
jgi:Flp pilus assembly pilin Flp